MKKKFIKEIKRQMGILICLLLFNGNAGDHNEMIVPMLAQYFEKEIISYDNFNTESVMNESVDTGYYKKIYSSIIYDMFYYENNIYDKKKEKEITSSGKIGYVYGMAGFKKWGLNGGIYLKKIYGSWSGETFKFSGKEKIETSKMTVGGWWKLHPILLTMNLSSDIKKIHENSTITSYPLLLFKTPVIDLYTSARISLKQINLIMIYENGTPYPSETIINSESNSAYRKIPIYADENNVGIVTKYEGKSLDVTVKTLVNRLTEAYYEHQKHNTLPLEIKGNGLKTSIHTCAKKIIMKPEFNGTFQNEYMSVKGNDNGGNEYLKISDGKIRRLEGAIRINYDKKSVYEIIVSNINYTGGKGKIDLYPFTSWMMLFDLPERYKIYYESLKYFETGISGKKNISLGKKQMVEPKISITGCEINGETKVADLMLYMNLLPIYENERIKRIEKKYAIIKGAIEYSINMANSTTTINCMQIVPIEINKRKDTKTDNDYSTEGKRIKKYGGMNISVKTIITW